MKGLKTCEIGPKTLKIVFRFQESGFGAFPKPADFVFCGFWRSENLRKPKGLSGLHDLQEDPIVNYLSNKYMLTNSFCLINVTALMIIQQYY